MGQAELTLELLALPAAPSHSHAARGPCAAAGRPLSLTSAPRAATAAATRASALRARVPARGGVCRECECAAARRCVCLAVCACTRLSVLSSSPVLARWSPVRAFLFSGKLFAEDQSPSQAQSTGLWSRRRPRASGSPGRTQQWSPDSRCGRVFGPCAVSSSAQLPGPRAQQASCSGRSEPAGSTQRVAALACGISG